eukprot:751158-Hanusia_phi.AAC.4
MFEHGLPPVPNPAARRWTWMQQQKQGYIPAQKWLSPAFFRQRMLQDQLKTHRRPVLSMGDLPIPIGYDGDRDHIAPGVLSQQVFSGQSNLISMRRIQHEYV